MATVKEVVGLPYRFGGREHSGWLPPGAAIPLPTPIEDVLLDVSIEAIEGGFLLFWQSQDRTKFGDTWHRTVAEAEQAAKDAFGISPADWTLP